MNTFINLVKKSLEVWRTRGEVEASGGARALLLLALNLFTGPWVPVSLSSSPAGLTGVLTQGLRQARDSGAIAKIWSWCCSSEQAGWFVGYRAFKIVKWSTYEITLGWTRWGDVQHKRKNGHVMWLWKTCANLEKMCKQLFSLRWDSG